MVTKNVKAYGTQAADLPLKEINIPCRHTNSSYIYYTIPIQNDHLHFY